MNIVYVSLKNLKRTPSRTWLLFGLVAVAACVLFTATLFLKSMDNALRIVASRFGADIIVAPKDAMDKAQAALLRGEPAHFLMDKTVLERVRGLQGVKNATPEIFLASEAGNFIVAFDPETDFTVAPWLERNLKRKLGGREVVAGKRAAARAGEELSFYGTPFVVAGVLEPAGTDFPDKVVFMSMDAAYRMAEQSKGKALKPLELGRDKISAVLVQMQTRMSDQIHRGNVVMQIEHDIAGVSCMVTDSVLKPVKKQFDGLRKAVVIVGSALWLIAFLILSFAFSMIVHERQRETGLLRAMGANRGQAASLFLAEAALLTGGGGAAGVACGYGLLLTLRGPLLPYFKLPLLFPSAGALAGLTVEALALALLSGTVAALMPTLAAMRMSPYVMIATGE